MRPWLFQFSPYISHENREELMAMVFIMKQAAYLDEIWRLRRVGNRARKPRSLSWPETCRTAKGYVLRTGEETNVLPIRKARKP